MIAAYPPGTPVRVCIDDPPHHTRAPRYVRGHSGVVMEMHGRHRVPDEVVGGVVDPQPQPVYAVRFNAHELWGAGDHTVTVNLWHCYLEPEGSP